MEIGAGESFHIQPTEQGEENDVVNNNIEENQSNKNSSQIVTLKEKLTFTEYVGVVETHPYNIAKTLEQNVNELIRYVNNVYKNIQTTDATCKLETYKAAKLEYLELLMDEREDLEAYNYVAYAFSYIVYEPGENLDVLMDHIDQLTAIAENAIVG